MCHVIARPKRVIAPARLAHVVNDFRSGQFLGDDGLTWSWRLRRKVVSLSVVEIGVTIDCGVVAPSHEVSRWSRRVIGTLNPNLNPKSRRNRILTDE